MLASVAGANRHVGAMLGPITKSLDPADRLSCCDGLWRSLYYSWAGVRNLLSGPNLAI